MKIKKKNLIIIIPAALLVILTLWMIVKQGQKKTVFSEKYIMAQELAPLLSFTYYDVEEWEARINKIAKGTVSYQELEELLEELGVRGYITCEEKAGWKKVPRSTFFQVYGQLLDLLDMEQKVTAEDRIFIGEEPKDGSWLTQKGYEKMLGGEQYIRRYDMYRVYILDGAILGIEKKLDTAVTWENVFIHRVEDETAQILFEKELLTVDIPKLEEKITNTVCDIEWKNKAVEAIYKKEETIQGTVLSYNESQIEIAGYGALEHSGNLKIYKTYGTVEQLDESKLIIGNLVADFVVAEGKVCGIILKEPAKIQDIRVLLLNGETPYYDQIYISANEEADISFSEDQQKLAANTVIKASDYWKEDQEGYLKVEMPSETGKLFLTNEKGETASLGYQGSFEVRKYQEGYCIVNELSLEDYLCAVVPSEMPAAYETEALRAQAVCARSYACIQLSKGKYAELGANVDDSTNYQVYNKQAGNERSTLAVRDTVGEVIKYDGEIAEAYYYSTSCGFSQNMDVWGEKSDGSNSYLKSVSLLRDESQLNLVDEAVFLEYIKNKDYAAYDSDAGYFRWKADLDLSASREKINEIIDQRRTVNPDNLLILDKDGNASEKSPSDLGKIQKITPVERSGGGVLKKLRIDFEKGSILVITEYNIRKILGAAAISMTDKNDKEISSMTLLPSAAFTAVPTEEGCVLYGGGYGHGIGLSQNGANGMAKAGFTYTDILQKFYQDIVLENIYNSQAVE